MQREIQPTKKTRPRKRRQRRRSGSFRQQRTGSLLTANWRITHRGRHSAPSLITSPLLAGCKTVRKSIFLHISRWGKLQPRSHNDVFKHVFNHFIILIISHLCLGQRFAHRKCRLCGQPVRWFDPQIQFRTGSFTLKLQV